MRALLLALALLSPALSAEPATLDALATTLGATYQPAARSFSLKGNKALTPEPIAAIASNPVEKITFDSCGAFTAPRLEALAHSRTLTELNLTHSIVKSTEEVRLLTRLSSLQVIDLGGSNFGDEGLGLLCTLPNLRALLLGHVGRDERNHFTTQGLQPLTKLPRLERLTLHLHHPDPAMIPVLGKLTTLRELKVGGVSSDFLASLQAALPSTKVQARGKPVNP